MQDPRKHPKGADGRYIEKGGKNSTPSELPDSGSVEQKPLTLMSDSWEAKEDEFDSFKRDVLAQTGRLETDAESIADDSPLVEAAIIRAAQTRVEENGESWETAISKISADDVGDELDLYQAYTADDIRQDLKLVGIDNPVLIVGRQQGWQGTVRRFAVTDEYDNVGDLVSHQPWEDMDDNTWSVNEDGDLEYSGVHHDGTNSCVFRELNDGAKPPRRGYDDKWIETHTHSIGTKIREHYGMTA